MIAATMLSLTLIATLIALAAWAVERACVRLALPRRFTWLVAMLAMCAAPLLPDGVLTRVPVHPAPSAPVAGIHPATAEPAMGATEASRGWWPPTGAVVTFFGALPMTALVGAANLVAASARWLRPLDGVLLTLWGAATIALLGLTARSAVQLQRAQRQWLVRHRGGVNTPPVYVSENIGPAAFGVGRGEIVIPRWAMHLPPLERRLLLLHERSHIEAGDPRLLAFGLAMLILLPWLMPLRWAYRRLQRAIEHDCDRRVLHRPHLARRYAELLLHAAEHGVASRGWSQRALASLGGPGLTMTSLLPGEPALEARLRGLVAPPVTLRARLDASIGVALGGMLTMAACTVPVPEFLTPLPIATVARFAVTGGLQRDAAFVTGMNQEASLRSPENEWYFARHDSLVISAIQRSRPELIKLAATRAPFVAIALTPDNEIIEHSIGAGAPPTDAADSVSAALRYAEAAAQAGLGTSGFSDAAFRGRMSVAANDPAELIEGLGISHLRVGTNPLTVLWVRFKDRATFP